MRQWIGSATSHYLNQYRVIVNWTTRIKLKWDSNQNTKNVIHENTSENIFWQMAAILSRGQLIRLEFFPNGPIDIKSVVVQVMAWRRKGNKPISEQKIMVCFTNAHKRYSASITRWSREILTLKMWLPNITYGLYQENFIKSTLGYVPIRQLMTWCYQATSNYRNQRYLCLERRTALLGSAWLLSTMDGYILCSSHL